MGQELRFRGFRVSGVVGLGCLGFRVQGPRFGLRVCGV